ncbi:MULTISPECIES: SDR family oxidoreductase [unclassified Rhizobium]|uniref:SDR family NAD(P)-dependent oxidoreductase n=1 Tax=unclassified Rhizobium TaxID=2613769 RepID=UPI001AEB0392|nr:MULTISPECIES: SDR family oxidoreductase [unclassified Rhizobium]MBP2460037.1 NAD(P)-dependent dehydrogenase (short-subunit alcohol dehydrogenase family) [Rhizobium sp. PvP014]MBP2531396.1 NAD(P)-dependent dehydrogenase (short-subunit alcohol dehydrogenase family) [Rhizobium sp. PvP099]
MSGLFNLAGKRALVTGASRGIGRAVAEGLAEAGAEVTLCARSRPEIEEACAVMSTRGWRARPLVCDVTDIAGFRQHVEAQAPFDIFVNNAGTNRPKPLTEVTEDDYDAVFGLNTKAAIFAAQSVTAVILRHGRRGTVINMSSQMGHVGAANRTLYCGSKFAIEGFTKALAVELGPAGIRINTLCPTFIETPMTASYFEDEEFRRETLSKIKLGRLGQPADVVGAAIFLASDASSLMTGSALMIDGGWTAD